MIEITDYIFLMKMDPIDVTAAIGCNEEGRTAGFTLPEVGLQGADSVPGVNGFNSSRVSFPSLSLSPLSFFFFFFLKKEGRRGRGEERNQHWFSRVDGPNELFSFGHASNAYVMLSWICDVSG